MKILTNARHWKQTAFGLVEITYNPDKDLVRAKLEMITKMKSHAYALANMTGEIVVPTSSECSTPEQIIDAGVKIWLAQREEARKRKEEYEKREATFRELEARQIRESAL